MKNIKYNLSDRTNMFYWQTNRNISAQDMKTVFLDRRNTISHEDTIRAIEFGMRQTGISQKDSKVVHLGDPIPRGSVNNVLKAKITDGSKIVVRMHPYHVQNGYFWAESIAAGLAKKQGVPTFDTLFIDDSNKHFDFDYMIMESLPGKTLQDFWPLDPKLDASLMRETGKYAALIHQVHPQGYGFFDNHIAKTEKRLQGQYPQFSDHFTAGLEEDFSFLVDHGVFSVSQQTLVEKVFSKHHNLLDCPTPSLIHNDIADWNQLSDGKHITGMIDWDECFSGDPVMDFAQWSLFFNDDRLQHFIDGYQQVSPIPSAYEEKIHLYRLRYVVSKLHLRKKRASVLQDSSFLEERIKRGLEVMQEEFIYFKIG